MRMRLVLDGGSDVLGIRLEGLHVTDGTDRGAVAGAHAGRAQDAHAGTQFPRQLGQQLFGARHRTRQRVANAHGDCGRRQLTFLHHIEMRIEGRDLIDLGQRQFHLGGERGEMRGGKTAIGVLNEMQMLDQQIAPARLVAEQRAHFLERLRIDLPAFRSAPRPAVRLPRATRGRRLNIHRNLQAQNRPQAAFRQSPKVHGVDRWLLSTRGALLIIIGVSSTGLRRKQLG